MPPPKSRVGCRGHLHLGFGTRFAEGTHCQLNSSLVTLRPQGSGLGAPAQLGRVVWLTLGGEGGSPPGGAQPHPAVLLPLSQGMSETFETLHNLVHKGVKVVMDIPYELWNETSAEVADLKKQVPRPVGLVLRGCSDFVGWSGEGGVSKGALLGAGWGQNLWQRPWSCHTSISLERGSPLCPSVMCW